MALEPERATELSAFFAACPNGLCALLPAAEHGIDKVGAQRCGDGGRRVRDGALRHLLLCRGLAFSAAFCAAASSLRRCFSAAASSVRRSFSAAAASFCRCFSAAASSFWRCFSAAASSFRRCFSAAAASASLRALALKLLVRRSDYLICRLAVDAFAVLQVELVRRNGVFATALASAGP